MTSFFVAASPRVPTKLKLNVSQQHLTDNNITKILYTKHYTVHSVSYLSHYKSSHVLISHDTIRMLIFACCTSVDDILPVQHLCLCKMMTPVDNILPVQHLCLCKMMCSNNIISVNKPRAVVHCNLHAAGLYLLPE